VTAKGYKSLPEKSCV